MAGAVSHGTEACNMSYRQPRLWVRANSHCSTHPIDSLPLSFLDTVTTDIIHYESKKLVYYRGNLSSFVEKHPEAKSYYTLAATSVKFSFPPPGSLMGVRSNTRAILKMNNCTFTYPGRSVPSLYNVSCALSLSRWVYLHACPCLDLMGLWQPRWHYRSKWCRQIYTNQASYCM
jgi:hypothetical protein